MAYFAPYLDGSGIHAPSYEDRLQDLMTSYASIFGNDMLLDENIPDYQLLSVFAKALDDVTGLALNVLNCQNPNYARNSDLDFLAQLYGVTRLEAESDAALRLRIRDSAKSKSVVSLIKMRDAIKALQYVADAAIYVNETGSTDDRGIPGSSLACVVYSGRLNDIAQVIFDYKAPGLKTYGDASGTAYDSEGRSQSVYFKRPDSWLVTIVIEIRHLEGYDSAVETMIKNGVVSFVQGLGIGRSLVVSQIYAVCYGAVPASYRGTFMIADVLTSTSQGSHSDVYPCAWDERLTTRADVVYIQEEEP